MDKDEIQQVPSVYPTDAIRAAFAAGVREGLLTAASLVRKEEDSELHCFQEGQRLMYSDTEKYYRCAKVLIKVRHEIQVAAEKIGEKE